MRTISIIVLALFIFTKPNFCQTKAKISDVDFHLEDKYIVVNYNLTGAGNKKQLTINLSFVTDKNETINPRLITGDIGTKIYTDGPKTVLWDIYGDQVEVSGSMKAVLTITSSNNPPGGPSNAFLSLIIPGLGGYFVDKNKLRSVLTTVSATGLMGYGIYEKVQAQKFYQDYNDSQNSSEIVSLYNTANSHNHKFYTAATIAAGIWTIDIIYVIIKGAKNKNSVKPGYNSFRDKGLIINYAGSGLQIGYHVTF